LVFKAMLREKDVGWAQGVLGNANQDPHKGVEDCRCGSLFEQWDNWLIAPGNADVIVGKSARRGK
jgi:hypothetical protein